MLLLRSRLKAKRYLKLASRTLTNPLGLSAYWCFFLIEARHPLLTSELLLKQELYSPFIGKAVLATFVDL